MKERRAFSVDDLLSLKIASELTAGPGSRVAFTVREADLEESSYRTHVWAVAPGESPVQLTRGEKSCSSPQWAPDGRHLAFVSSRPDGKAGDDGPRAQVWLLPAAGGEAFCLTRAPAGVRCYQWSPDGRTLYYAADEPDSDAARARKARERKRKLDAVVEQQDRQRRQIWKVEAREGAEPTLVHAGDLGLKEIAVSPDGRHVAYTTNYTGLADDFARYDLWLVEAASGRTLQLTRGLGGVWGPEWSPDGSQIAFVAPHDPRFSYSRVELFAVPAAGGPAQNLCEAYPNFTGDIVDHRWISDGDLLVEALVGCYTHLYRLRAGGGLLERLTPADEVVTGALALAPDRTGVAYLRETSCSVPEVMWLAGLTGGGEPRALTDLNPKLATDIQWAGQRVISWPGEGGLTIEGVLTLPAGRREGERHPLLVYLHGGPHGRVANQVRQYVNFQALAAQGYAVLAPNFRGSEGYGHAHAVANHCDLGGADFRDIMAGVDHVIAMGVADGDRLGVLGGSYGGYMTNWAISQTDRFKAAVSLFGMFSLVTDYSQSEMPSFELVYLDGFWWENPERYAQCSPSTFAANIRTPVLIIHGEADTNTNPANSREMYQTLRHLDRVVEYVHYPREGHGLTEPNHKKDEYRRIVTWFDRYLLGREPAVRGAAVRDGHRLEVEPAEAPQAFAGRKPKGRYMTAELQLAPGPEGLKLDMARVRLQTRLQELTWEVALAGVVAGEVLVPCSGTLEVGAPAVVRLVFELPDGAPGGEWELVTEYFAPLVVELR